MKIYEIGLADDSMIKITNDDDSFIALVPKGYLSIRGNPHPNFVYVYINAFQFEPVILGYDQILKQDGSTYGNSVAELLMNIASIISFEQSKDDILQNGNSFGTGIIIGSKDNFSLNFKTNNVNRLGISSSGTINIPQFSGLGSKLLGIDNSGNLTSVFGILQNGNTFGDNVIIGTNDTYDLVLETNNTPRLIITSGGTINLPQFSGSPGNYLTLDVDGNIVSTVFSGGTSPTTPSLQQVTDVSATTTNTISVLDVNLERVVTLRDNSGEGEIFVENHATNEIGELRPDSLSFYNSVANFQLRVPTLTTGRTQNLQDASGTIALLSDMPLFLSETSTIEDFETGKTYFYIGETPITYDYDLLPYPSPVPVTGFNFVNQSVFDVVFSSDGGNTVYILKPNQSFQDIQVIDNGGFWGVYTTQYFDNHYDLQQVTNKANTTTNALIVRNNPDNYRTRYSILGQQIQRNDLGYEVNYVDNAITKKTFNDTKSWDLLIPDLTTNPNNSSFSVNFRPNVNGTIAYLSDISNSLSGYTTLIEVSKSFYVSKQGNDTLGNGSLGSPYLTIKKAVDEVNLLASDTNPISISIESGVYLEDTIILNPYVFIKSTDQDSTIVKPNDDTLPLFQIGDFNGLSFLTIEGVINSTAVEIDNASEYCVLHKVYIRDSNKGVTVNSTITNSYAYLEYVSIDSSLNCAIEAISSANITELSCENTYMYNIASLPSVSDVISNGANTKILFHTGSLVNQFSIGTNKGFYSINSGNFRIRNTQTEGYQYGVYVDSGSPNIVINGCTFDNNIYNFYINSATATGEFQGYTEYTKQFVHTNSGFFIANSDNQIITVAKKGGNFTSVKAAVDSIIDASSSKRYIVQIGTGIFVEDTITMKPFVDIKGTSFTNTIIEVDNVNKNIIIAAPNSGLFELQLRGATGSSVSAIQYTGGAGVFRCFSVRFGANYRFYNQNSTTAAAVSIFQTCSAEATSNFTTAFEITDNGVNLSTFAFNTFTYIGNGSTFIKTYGTLTAVSSANCTVSKTVTDGYGVHCYNGATISINNATFQGFDVALYNENIGVGVILYTGAFSLRNNTNDIQILSPTTTGSIFGFFTLNKCTVDNDANISLLFTDITGQGTASLGKLWLGSKFNNLFDAKDLITSGSMGLHQGGVLTIDSGLSINISIGYGYLEDNSTNPSIYKRINWVGSSLTLLANSDVYVYFNSNGTLTTNTARPNVLETIILGRVYTNATDIIFIDLTPNNADHLGNKLSEFSRVVFGAIYASGSLTTSNSSRQLQVTSGNYWLSENNFLPTGKAFVSNFTPIYQNSTPGSWIFDAVTAIVLNDKYDDGSGTLVNATASYYVKHNLFLITGDIERYFLLVGQEEHSTLNAATNASNPNKPDFFKDSVVLIASVITKQGDATFTQVADERPTPLFKASGSLGVTSHSALSDLGNNDHLQYLLKAGDTMGGNLDLGGNQITNVGNIDGVDVSNHASRHLPNGSDPLTVGTPISISRQTNNVEGIANAFARQDHTHNVIEEVATVIGGLGTVTITKESNNKVIATGAVFGKRVNLGDATTYTIGKIITLYNNSSQTLLVINNGLTSVFRLLPFCKLEIILQDNTTPNGVWYFSVTYPDYNVVTLVLEDFIASTIAGQTGWAATTAGTGAGVLQATSLFGRQGVNSLTTGTTATGRTSISKSTSNIIFGNGLILLEMSIRLEVLSNATDRYIYYAGFGDNLVAGDHTDGVYFEYNEGVSGNFWRLKTSDNNTKTTVITPTAILANTWYNLKIEIEPNGGRADFFVNGENVGNINSNIPTGLTRNTGHLLKIQKTAGVATRTCYVDYINLKTFLQR